MKEAKPWILTAWGKLGSLHSLESLATSNCLRHLSLHLLGILEHPHSLEEQGFQLLSRSSLGLGEAAPALLHDLGMLGQALHMAGVAGLLLQALQHTVLLGQLGEEKLHLKATGWHFLAM